MNEKSVFKYSGYCPKYEEIIEIKVECIEYHVAGASSTCIPDVFKCPYNTTAICSYGSNCPVYTDAKKAIFQHQY